MSNAAHKTLGRIRRRFRKDEKASEKLRYERAQTTLALTAASVDSASADKCLQQKPPLYAAITYYPENENTNY